MRRSAITIRPTRESDAHAVVALLADVAREERWIAAEWPFDLPEREAAFRDALLERKIVSWSALDGAELIGELDARHIDDGFEPDLGMMVAASHRGRGIGRALLEAVIAWAAARKTPSLALRVFPDNDAALALYRKMGFIELGTDLAAVPRRNGAPRDAIRMRKTL